MTNSSAFPMIRRLRAPAALLALALGLAACTSEAETPVVNEPEEAVDVALPEVAEEAPVAPPVVENVLENVVEANVVGISDEARLSAEEQIREDADATGMTSRYAGEETVSEPGNDAAEPVE